MNIVFRASAARANRNLTLGRNIREASDYQGAGELPRPVRRGWGALLVLAIGAWLLASGGELLAVPMEIIHRFQDGVVNGQVADVGYHVDDTYLNGCCSAEPTNYGSATTLTTTRVGSGNRQSIYRYDLTAIEPDAQVLSASFTFQAAGLSGIPRDWAWSIYEIPAANTAWTEMDATFLNQVQSLATPWKNNLGIDAANGVAAILTGRQVGFFQQYFETDSPLVTITLDPSIVQDWVSTGGPLTGFMLFAESNNALVGGNGGIRSSEFATLLQRPLLTIHTAVPPAPEPGSFALIGLGAFGLARHTRRQRRV